MFYRYDLKYEWFLDDQAQNSSEEGDGEESPDAAMAEADDIISLSQCLQSEFLGDQAVQKYFTHVAAEEFSPGSRNGNARWEKYDQLSLVDFFGTIVFPYAEMQPQRLIMPDPFFLRVYQPGKYGAEN